MTTPRFCQDCGRPLRPGSHFCAACGSRVVVPRPAPGPASTSALHHALAALARDHGAGVLADADALRGAMDDYLDEGTAPTGTVNLLTDAVRLGALGALRAMIAAGADPERAVRTAGERLARDRGSTATTGATWACATLGFAVGEVPEPLVVRLAAEQGDIRSAPVAPSRPAPPPVPPVPQPASPTPAPLRHHPPVPPPLPVAGPTGRSRVGRVVLVGACAVPLMLAVGAGTAYLLTRGDDPATADAAPRDDADEPPPRDATTAGTECAGSPAVTPTAAAAEPDALVVTVDLLPGCPDGQWLADSRLGMPLHVDGVPYAAAWFDLSAAPVWIPEAGATLELSYPYRTVWATPNEVLDGIQRDAGSGDVVTVTVAPGDGSTTGAIPDDPADGPVPTAAVPGLAPGVDEPLPEVDDPDQVALAALRRIAEADEAVVESSLMGSWIPQLSSALVDTAPDGAPSGADQVLAHHLELRAQYPDALLVDSTSWASFQEPGYWVTARAAPESSSTPVLEWCRSEGWSRDDCLAKRIVRTGSSEGNTDLWPPDAG